MKPKASLTSLAVKNITSVLETKQDGIHADQSQSGGGERMGGESGASVRIFPLLDCRSREGHGAKRKAIPAQVLSPLEQRDWLQPQPPALPTGGESNSFVCKSHCHLKNKPTGQRTSVRKQIQVPVADWVSKEDWTLARLTLAEPQCEARIYETWQFLTEVQEGNVPDSQILSQTYGHKTHFASSFTNSS